MTDVDVEALRTEIGKALGESEVWHLLQTYSGYGREGSVRVELWEHPKLGYRCEAHPQDGEPIHANPEPTAELAMQNTHLWNLGSHG